jgi:hypothetical protein
MALNSEVESSLVLTLLDAFHEEKVMVQQKFLKIVMEHIPGIRTASRCRAQAMRRAG